MVGDYIKQHREQALRKPSSDSSKSIPEPESPFLTDTMKRLETLAALINMTVERKRKER